MTKLLNKKLNLVVGDLTVEGVCGKSPGKDTIDRVSSGEKLSVEGQEGDIPLKEHGLHSTREAKMG